jgi:hypothetical protein
MLKLLHDDPLGGAEGNLAEGGVSTKTLSAAPVWDTHRSHAIFHRIMAATL